jgi:hypothetical protein
MKMENNFVVDTDAKADWAIEKINEHKAERDRLIDVCKERIAEYQDKIEQYEQEFQNETKFFVDHLRNYFDVVKREKMKTFERYRLPSGTLKLKFKEKIQKDEEKLLNWLLHANMKDYIETKTVAKWGELKKGLTKSGNNYVTEDGEIVEGVEVHDLGGEFIIE